MRYLLPVFLAFAPLLAGQSVSGLWDAAVTVNGVRIPFRYEIAQDGGAVKGFFFNGEERVGSTGGSLEEGHLVLRYKHYASRLDVKVKDGNLEGTYGRESKPYPFEAKRFTPRTEQAEAVPSIEGLWEIPTKSPKGESAWRFIVRQSGAEVSATILRVDGDTGTLAGTYKDGKFVLSHFSGARPSLLEVTWLADGTLELLQNGKTALTAIRSTEARTKGLPEPADPTRFTSVKDPAEPFHFSGRNLAGDLITDADGRFRNKVVIVAISGSWCPNCHDEAPFLEELYRKYGSQGLEIVALSFEEQEQQKDLGRLRAFVKQYGIGYTVLVPGEPSELKDKLPQAVNLNSWPTTFFLGRDGRVRSVHAGFAGAASGEFHTKSTEEITALVERLIGESNFAAIGGGNL